MMVSKPDSDKCSSSQEGQLKSIGQAKHLQLGLCSHRCWFLKTSWDEPASMNQHLWEPNKIWLICDFVDHHQFFPDGLSTFHQVFIQWSPGFHIQADPKTLKWGKKSGKSHETSIQFHKVTMKSHRKQPWKIPSKKSHEISQNHHEISQNHHESP